MSLKTMRLDGKGPNKIKENVGDRLYLLGIYGFLWLCVIVMLYPLVYILSCSFSSPIDLIQGKVVLWPVNPTILAYKTVFSSDLILAGYKNTVLYTVVGTFINVALTLLAAYPLSRRDLAGKNLVMMLFTFTMFFSGGMIPTYIVVKTLHMTNTMWALILPSAISVWMMIIARTFFISSIPDELLEAATIDGCGNTRFFFSMVLPLSKPIIAVMTLMYAVGMWNSYFSALIYLDDQSKYPLQLILRQILIMNQVDDTAINRMKVEDMMTYRYLSELLKYALIVVSSLPVMLFYPFIQKYFIKGVMIGSLKG